MKWTPHPIIKIPTREEAEALNDQGKLLEYYQKREELIQLEAADPYTYGTDHHNTSGVFDHWKDVDDAIDNPDIDVIYIFGGNRGGKSRYLASRMVRAMVNRPNMKIWCCHSSNDSSIQVQQPYIHTYLPLQWKEQKKTVRSVANISFTQKNGFSGRTIVGPNHSQMWFKNYTQDLSTLEGTELDLIWFDELVPQAWVETLKYRLVSRKGKMLITFTPIEGYSTAVKSAMDGAMIEETRKAKLIDPKSPGTIPGVPPGHMPYKGRTKNGSGKLFWFFSEWNPYTPFDRLQKTLKGRTREELEIRAYGYVSNPVTGKFPRFTDRNIIKASDVPREGTNYMVCDPTPGDRNWFFLWARVDDLGRVFVYREFPDYKNHGEWAVPSSKLDGKPGPAQTADCGRNIAQWKQLIREVEKSDGGIHERYIDPRAGRTAVLGQREHNQSLIDLLATPDRGAGGQVTQDGLHFTPASMAHIDESVALVNNLFAYNLAEEVTVLNEPKLYISEECGNLIYSLRTWTNADGDKGACKDPCDALRYLILMDPMYVPRQAEYTSEPGSY
jgi:phage terminase large subunit-like protein